MSPTAGAWIFLPGPYIQATSASVISDTYVTSLPHKHLFMSCYIANIIAHYGVLDAGGSFIQKPFSRQELGVIVRKVLDSA